MSLVEQAILGTSIELGSSMTSASPVTAASTGKVVGYDRQGHPITRYGWKTIEQVAAELRAKYPEPVRGAPLAVDIIRADRDSR